jgi:xanthine dehydrogenase YagS FAD-binding subunit
VATVGGNLLQRPRCWYYRQESYRCLKKGGPVCFAAAGENRYHSIFGGGTSWAVHPSNAAVPLVALGASFVLSGEKGSRTVAAADFFTRPEADPERENVLAPGEILTAIHVPAPAGSRSAWGALRERAAVDWPLVAAAVSIRLAAGKVADARIVLGAVAPVPWRVEKAEQALHGHALEATSAGAAAALAAEGAQPLDGNGYKVALVQVVLRRTLLSLA